MDSKCSIKCLFMIKGLLVRATSRKEGGKGKRVARSSSAMKNKKHVDMADAPSHAPLYYGASEMSCFVL